MRTIGYDRRKAADYAKRWAFRRNPAYYDFSRIGGDCTNFVSQCLYAGSKLMNFIPVFGWYYRSAGDRTPSWSGVRYLYDFLTGNNAGAGPFGRVVVQEQLQPGDIIQLARGNGEFYHTLLVTGKGSEGRLVAAHSDDALDRPLWSYSYRELRAIHIEGFRAASRPPSDAFEALYNGAALP